MHSQPIATPLPSLSLSPPIFLDHRYQKFKRDPAAPCDNFLAGASPRFFQVRVGVFELSAAAPDPWLESMPPKLERTASELEFTTYELERMDF